ncbi:RtcB family protein [Candidatus Woesearchaeota archaeon]|nr:RtcB family protein [Candidatus Woesearchaeota archaeon]
MNVPGRIYGDKQIISHLIEDVNLGKQWNALKQVYNVACLPGIQKASLAMPDVHPGYGFAIGGVGAFDTEKGVISVAGVGFDINCGVRCLRTNLTKQDILQNQEKLAETLYQIIPAGLGSKGDIKLNFDEINDVLVKGAEFCVERKYGTKEDLKFIEENGRIDGANPNNVSDLAKKRQFKQIGTLGSGNHYLEVQYVDEIHDEKAAKAYNLQKDQVIISIHCGSRALGHQIGTDYLKELAAASRKYKIPIREKELVCAPFKSQEGQKYFSAVNAGINCAFANRQALAHLTRTAFEKALGTPHKDITTLYEVAHNTCKLEEHDGMQLIIHRKGATRAFGPGKKEIPEAYQETGQPVIIGGTMGTHSYILHGTEKGMQKTFGSACHGAGRIMSRNEAKRKWRGTDVLKDLRDKGIIIKGHSFAGIAEEAPGAYKEVTEVVNVMHDAHIARKVVKVKPLVVVKG